MLAPALKAGANTPPDAPVVKHKTGPIKRNSGVYQGFILEALNNKVLMTSLPDQSTSVLMKIAIETISNAQTITYKYCPRFEKFFFQSKRLSMILHIRLPPKPVRMATITIPPKIYGLGLFTFGKPK